MSTYLVVVAGYLPDGERVRTTGSCWSGADDWVKATLRHSVDKVFCTRYPDAVDITLTDEVADLNLPERTDHGQ